ncbi:MAG: sigma-54-dependent Fis family transcriptional regulator [Acidobacteria bacterium]|nr:sigma-54-dependent Fis family transcriptional regulator [Acidobacteriota bacterium]
MVRRVLIVDDEANIGRTLALILEGEGFQTETYTSAAAFRAQADTLRPAVLLLDVRLAGASGIDLLKELRAAASPLAAIMISGHATIADAVEATRHGAYDFLEKPLARDKVLLTVKNAFEQLRLREENARLRELAGPDLPMIGASPVFVHAVEQARLSSHSDARVLLTGESGTGKELLASFIHHQSPFATGPFEKVNCAAIPTELLESELFGHEKGSFTGAAGMRRGKFELADGGTQVLDEVGDLHGASQAKLLRVLQEGEFHRVGGEKSLRVSVRVVSATNRDLAAMVARNEFREDLYYRLCVVPIRVPALRERAGDVPALATHFLAEFCRRNNFRAKRFSPETFDVLAAYAWPGNIRELRNAVERMAILTSGELLTPESVPVEIRHSPLPTRSSVQEVRHTAERDHVLRALEAEDWNVSAAARRLGVERTALHKRIRALGLKRS